MSARRSSVDWRVQFVVLAAIWGASFLFIKVLDRHWPVLWVSFGRIALGALALALLMALRGERFPADRGFWLACAGAAVLFNAVPWTLFAFGERHTSSIVAGLWNATTPMWVLIVSLIAFDEERPTTTRVAGLTIGFLGVAILLGPWRGLGGGQLIGQLACAVAAVFYGIGFPYSRRYLTVRAESGVVLTTGQLACAAAMLAPFLLLARAPTAHIGFDGWGSILALGVLGSGVGFAINYSIVRSQGIGIASTVTYLIPVFSTILGAVVLGEPLHWYQPLGTVVLLLGIATLQGRLSPIYRAIRRTMGLSSPRPSSSAPAPTAAPRR
jgi:drug/metabolite transporter (DMT)-like permease